MIFLVLLVCAGVALLPLALVLRGGGVGRSRRDSALAIHRAQLTELERDRAAGRIAPAEYASAVLEVQRRLLAAAEATEGPPPRAARGPLLATLLVVPVVAVALYALDGQPFLPAAPLAGRLAAADRTAQDAGGLVATLRAKLATMDQQSETARQGYVLLGNAEDAMGHLPQAAQAWRQAVAIRFDPALAALTAEAQTRLEGHMSADSADLFRRALAAAAPDAPWRTLVEARLNGAPPPPQ